MDTAKKEKHVELIKAKKKESSKSFDILHRDTKVCPARFFFNLTLALYFLTMPTFLPLE